MSLISLSVQWKPHGPAQFQIQKFQEARDRDVSTGGEWWWKMKAPTCQKMVSISQDQFLLKILYRNASVLSPLTAWPWVGFLQEQSSPASPTARKTIYQPCSSPETSGVQLVRLCQVRHFFWNLLPLLFLLLFYFPPGKTQLSASAAAWKMKAHLCLAGPEGTMRCLALLCLTWDLLHGFRSSFSAQPEDFRLSCTGLQGCLIPNSPGLPCHRGCLFLKTFITASWTLLLENWRWKEP